MRRNFSIYLIILSLCLLSGIASLIFGPHLPPLQIIDSHLFQNTTQSTLKEKNLLLEDYDGVSPARHYKKLIRNNIKIPPLTILDFDLNNSDIYSTIPPTASDVAGVLDELQENGVKHLHFSTQFYRDTGEKNFSGLVQVVLSPKRKNAFENVLIPLQFERSTVDSKAPTYLTNCSLDASSVNGDITKIPRVNNTIFSPIDKINFTNSQEILNLPCIKFGFNQLKSKPITEGKTPLLAIWGDRIILHQLLLSSMILHEATFSDLKITLGKSINLGPHKPIIPIDEFGFTTIRPNSKKPSLIFPAHHIFNQLINQKQNENKPNPTPSESATPSTKNPNAKNKAPEFGEHVLIVSTPTASANIQLINKPFEKITHLYQVSEYKRIATFYRLPLWLEACLLVELTLICASLHRLTGIERHLSYALFLTLLWPILTILASLGYWMPFSPAFVLILTGYLISLWISSKWNLRRASTSIQNHEKKELARFR